MHRLLIDVDPHEPSLAATIDLNDEELAMIEFALSKSVDFWKKEVAQGHAGDLHALAVSQHATWSALLSKLEGE